MTNFYIQGNEQRGSCRPLKNNCGRLKLFFTIVILLLSLGLSAQPYNNEWINFSNTYYKFKVGATGVYRIPQSVLATAGLGNVPVQNYQLFRNGQEVPIYTSAASGTLGSSDYIEFWGQINDGVPDAPLYYNPVYQHTQHWSLETDTAEYFLTVNATGNTFHYQNVNNDPGSSTLTPAPYFMYTAGSYFKAGINPGYAQIVGEYIYSSSYDLGEFWATGSIVPGTSFSDQQSNLYVYGSGPNASINFGMVGTADDVRTVQLAVNGSVLADTVMNSFNDLQTNRPVPLSLITSNAATITYVNNSPVSTDRMVASFYELTYPRQFNFGGQENFPFQLPANGAGYLLNISGVTLAGGSTPVLYDMTNGLRYTAVVASGICSFALPGSTANMNLVLVNEDPAILQTVTGLTSKNFVNFANTSNQGNYLIISNPVLYNDGTSDGDNPVADYKTYRSSAAGGGFSVQIYDINELIDQFGFGIKKDPLSIQNFLRYARNTFSVKPQFVLLIGHGMDYSDWNLYSEQFHYPQADQLNLVPTYGYPASDNKLSANNGAGAVPVTPIGRLSVVSGAELQYYTAKIKEYEQAQQTSPNTIAGRLWMKDAVHLTGVSEPYLGTIICNYVTAYAQIISDTLCGSNVSIFCDGNASAVTQVPAGAISNLFSTGFSVLNYFGHSSNDVLAYNLDNPSDYNNTAKYPVMFVNGCDAGDFFIYDPLRFTTDKTLSETWVLAPEHGAIAFVASTNFGIVNYLNILLNGLYIDMSGQDYGKPLGILQQDALQSLINAAPGDFFARLHAEQMTTHGDPALKLNQGPTDYDIEASQVQINPAFISISNGTFNVKATIYNLGKAVNDSVVVQVTRTYPSGTTAVLMNKKIAPILYSDSIILSVPIVGTRDKGQNSITISVDPGQTIPEVTYANNSITTSFFIYQNEATPIYPYNYAIINTPTSKLIASTSNPIGASQQFIMEVDTTQLFNSPLMVTKYITSTGGELEFDPQISYRDSVVYYWRVGIVPATPGGNYTWNNASFIYIDPARSTTGFNQSHYFQHLGSTGNNISMAANRQWAFNIQNHNIYQRNAVYPDGGTYDVDFSVSVDGAQNIQSACLGQSLIFNVFDPVTLKPWANVDANGNNLYLSGSASANCAPTRNYNFEFSYMDAADREKMVRFMDSIPNGMWVTVKNIPFDYQAGNVYASTWAGDTATYGSGNSIYNRLKSAGLTEIDSFDAPRVFLFIYKKNDPSFTPQQQWSAGIYDAITLSSTCPGPYFTGTVTSPEFGPAVSWNSVHWRGSDLTSPATDTVGVQVIGIDTLGNFTPLFNMNRSTQDLNISAINAKQYPYLEFQMTTLDTVHALPYQLSYWRANYVPVPEGALAPNLVLKSVDTAQLGQNMEFEIAFKNVSPFVFPDSMTIQFYIQDHSNVIHNITLPRRKPLVSGDTIIFDYILNTTSFPGANTLYLDFNPNATQPEQYLFNNFLYKSFYVKSDTRNPTMDVTFDNVHILNNDIVSAKPHIQIKLQSQSQYNLLTDTSLVQVQVQYPDGSLHNYKYTNDTLRFTPATSGNNNTATVDFTPAFTTQYNPAGDQYQLVVTGNNAPGNTAAVIPYRVGFTVINKAMISNMLNYPNPFTTSTAFVFTITGSEVPQNIKIQILTITGKVVREITKEELGPLHVGLNISQYKWNGTDMYGNRLANGVYLYHVVTNLNGQSLQKYTAAGDNTSKFFNNGYGKMYLMK